MAASEAADSTFVWTQDRSIQCVELWEQEPSLWDKSHVNFKNSTIRFEALKRIGNELQTTPTVVQEKLRNIRTQHTRELKKLKTIRRTGGRAANKPPTKWFLYDYLQFLRGTTVFKGLAEEGLEEEEITLPPVKRSNSKKRKYENNDLSEAVVTLEESLNELSHIKEKEKAKDDCDIFGQLVAKRLRKIESEVIRMLAQEEVLNILTRKFCEDQEILLKS